MNNNAPTDIMTGEEVTALRLFLIEKQGYTPGQAGQALGQAVGRQRQEVGQNIVSYQRGVGND